VSETEEKKHQPTQSKLRRSRREGRVAQSRDVVALAALPVLFWLVFSWKSFENSIKRLMAEAFSTDFLADTSTITHKLFPAIANDAFYSIVLPISLVIILLTILLAIVDMGGFIFAAKPIAPDFSKLNPSEGFKRIFSARTGVEAAVGLLKLLVFSLFTFSIIYGGLDRIIAVQACGLPCLPRMFSIVIVPLIALSTLLYVFAAIVDYLVSRILFKRDMMMTDTELKRDNKESYGNPEVKRRRKDEGRILIGQATKLGPLASTMMVYGSNEVIGIRYVQGETAAPVIVAKGKDLEAAEMMALARSNEIPLVNRPSLAATLMARGMKGQFVPADTFTDVAAAIIASGN
jgi:type III secretion protein U